MSSAVGSDSRPIESWEQLIDYFRDGEKSRRERGVGTEHEKFLIRRDDLSMLSHGEEGGIEDLFGELVEQGGWEASMDCDRIIGLDGESHRITLEPGGQFELAGAINETIHQTESELDEHFAELERVAGDRLYFACWGMNPFYAPHEVPMVPKQRYDIMRSYLPTRGELALWMMKTSCTVQANFDYTSEEDAADLVRTALLVSPIVSALFANSPYRAGGDTGMQSFRGFAWTRTDPDRTGWPAFMYEQGWGYRQYLDYILDMPMFFVERQGRLQPMIGWTFREFVEEGHGVFEPQMQDFVLHLSTAFPEIRMKQFVEVRGADGGPREFMLALPALWKGLLYHGPSRRRVAALFEEMTPEEHEQLFMDVYADGLDATSPVGRVADLGAEVLSLASDGLDALAEENDHPSERGFLEPVREVVDTETTLADRMRRDFERFGGDRRRLIEEWSMV